MSFLSRRLRTLGITVVAAALTLSVVPARAAGEPRVTWLAGWATGQARLDPTGVALTEPVGRTIRLAARTAVDGSQVRVRLANTDGGAVTFGRATVGIRTQGGGPVVMPGTLRELRFGGRPSVTLARGATATSDPVPLPVAVADDLAVSLFVAKATAPYAGHFSARRVSWLSAPDSGDQTLDEAGSTFHWTTTSSYWLAGIDVLGRARPVVVAIGDSITDGHLTTPELDQDWPSVLARRLRGGAAVVNAGIAGNQVTRASCGTCGPSVVSRFGSDVLDVPGVTHVIVFAGTNDLGTGVSPARIADGLASVAARARQRGVRVIGATITPRQDLILGWNPAVHEPRRQALNAWIRTSRAFDAVVDFDAALRDPAAPTQLDYRYDSGDRLHPSVAGLEALGNSVDLRLVATR